MENVVEGRKTVVREQGLVVFIIGARINKWWLLPLAFPILSRMGAMQRELLEDPESGLLGIQTMGSAGTILYWRSVEDLLTYADDRKREHQPAAKRFFQKIFRNQAVGIWHETYVVPAGHFECIYTNMPRRGLGKVGPLVDAEGPLAHARSRLAPTLFPKLREQAA